MSYSLFPSGINDHDPATAPRYVACRADGTVRTFGSVQGLALYMSERPLTDWALFKWRAGWRRVQVNHRAVTRKELEEAIRAT